MEHWTAAQGKDRGLKNPRCQDRASNSTMKYTGLSRLDLVIHSAYPHAMSLHSIHGRQDNKQAIILYKMER